MHNRPASSLNPAVTCWKVLNSSLKAGLRDWASAWRRRNRRTREEEAPKTRVEGRERKKKTTKRSELPLCQSKNPIIILNQRWKHTKSCTPVPWISGLDQNNYRIISSSDNPRLIRLWFACAIREEEVGEEKAGRLQHRWDVSHRPQTVPPMGNNGFGVAKRRASNKRDWSLCTIYLRYCNMVGISIHTSQFVFTFIVLPSSHSPKAELYTQHS